MGDKLLSCPCALPLSVTEFDQGFVLSSADGEWTETIYKSPDSPQLDGMASFLVEAVNRPALTPAQAAAEEMVKAIEAMVNERYSEFDMMSCEHPRGSPEARAWEDGVKQAWKLWDLSKEPGIAALKKVRP